MEQEDYKVSAILQELYLFSTDQMLIWSWDAAVKEWSRLYPGLDIEKHVREYHDMIWKAHSLSTKNHTRALTRYLSKKYEEGKEWG